VEEPGIEEIPRKTQHPPETETGGNTEHCCHRGGRSENLDLNLDFPSSWLFASFVAWRKREKMVSKDKVEPLSL
jgi:hypothetical protein